jgi:hypothetical protein
MTVEEMKVAKAEREAREAALLKAHKAAVKAAFKRSGKAQRFVVANWRQFNRSLRERG